ncbi:glycogen synthase GlgA [Cardiobacteriaceae bacterium TAE3-ERU3]|nr:glycogen synthase GlgA [Cardiobacteriaceae bacterium TAE3-ERU3]
MNILHVASECYPLIKTGGLADVVGALPWAQAQAGHDVRLVLPYYPSVAEQLPDAPIIRELSTFAGGVALRSVDYHGVRLYLIDAHHLFARKGNPYHDANYHDYADNVYRFALLGWFGAALAAGMDEWWGCADVLHAHDWQAGLACAYLAHWQSPVKRIFTIHNLAYQGLFDAAHVPELALPWRMFDVHGLEFNGQLSMLKAGLYYADEITTVSPSYAQEITHIEGGCGLHGLLAERAGQHRLHGILNGIDPGIWSPEHDPAITHHYNARQLVANKRANKLELQRFFGLEEDKNALLMILVSRLTEQKGIDLLLAALPTMLDMGNTQFAILGSGEPALSEAFEGAAAAHPGRIGVYIGYDEALSHRMMAGGDLIAVPSRFEPCGLTQLYGMAYGTLPLVRRIGGLGDSVLDGRTGFVFDQATSSDLVDAYQRAVDIWLQPRKWQTMQRRAMGEDFGWHKAAQQYLALYEK